MEIRIGDKIVTVDDDFELAGAMYIGKNGYPYYQKKLVHRAIAEKALKRPLTSKEHVHHVDYNKLNARRANLVICDAAFHHLMHRRWDALMAGFDWRTHSLCSECKTYHPIEDFPKTQNAAREHQVHNVCKKQSNRIRKEKGYKTPWDWRLSMNQQFRRAIKKGVPLSVLPMEGSGP